MRRDPPARMQDALPGEGELGLDEHAGHKASGCGKIRCKILVEESPDFIAKFYILSCQIKVHRFNIPLR